MSNTAYDFLRNRGYGCTVDVDFATLLNCMRNAIAPNHSWEGTKTGPCEVDRFKTPALAVTSIISWLTAGVNFGDKP